MDERHGKLLKSIIDIYTKTALPVGSTSLAGAKGFDVSPATIRNEMAELEREGYIFQPHTSAGRVPTSEGYRYYIDNLMELRPVPVHEQKIIRDSYHDNLRSLAKILVDRTNLASIVGFAPNDLYFTGLFNLFSQPEFEDHRMMLSMSQVVDSLERAIADIYEELAGPRILFAEQSRLGQNCSLVVTSVGRDKNLLAVLGPVRMDYGRILSLFNEIVNIAK
ncbi:MAG: hypothetical protein C3F02_00145 [Parcubacteria group bacterium]|nr:MAG: hypothetical protein C3F02_00145 [Parcubacteria group bacterium]